MKQMFFRGWLTGLVGGLGMTLFFDALDEWQMTASQILGCLGLGAAFGVLQGLLMMLVLLGLRGVDLWKGWKLSARLEHSEPGLVGLMVGLLLTFPGATIGGVGLTIGAFEALRQFYLHGPGEWAFVIVAFMGMMVLPIAAFSGAAGGAMLGSMLGSGVVGLLRGLWGGSSSR